MSTDPKYALYYAPGAASMLVHWMLIELDLPHELRLVDLDRRQHKEPDYLALNPYGVVPTLVVDGRPRIEAPALAQWLAETHPQAQLVPAVDDPKRIAHLQWMFHLANEVQPLLRQWWYPHEPAGQAQADAVLLHVVPRLEAQWQRIDERLAARGPYLLGDAPGVVDFYLTMLLRWSRKMPRPGTDWPHLAALAASMKARESFKTLYAREGLTDWT